MGSPTVLQIAPPAPAGLLDRPERVFLDILTPLGGDILLHFGRPVGLPVSGQQDGDGTHGPAVLVPILRTQVVVEPGQDPPGGLDLTGGQGSRVPRLLGGSHEIRPTGRRVVSRIRRRERNALGVQQPREPRRQIGLDRQAPGQRGFGGDRSAGQGVGGRGKRRGMHASSFR